MIRIAICDDEEIMRSDIINKLEAYAKQTYISYQVYAFSNAEDLLKCNEAYDIIFLDIQMGRLSGLEAARKIRKKDSESYIVFVTVLKECVYDAFSVEASDYFIKPLQEERFRQTMDRIISHIEERAKKSLIIQKGSGYTTVRYTDIFYCEAINRKIYVHTKQGIINYYFKIEELGRQLESQFFKCHRSYLVNLQYVCNYENGAATLENGEKIPVSRLRQQEFIQAVLSYMKEGKK